MNRPKDIPVLITIDPAILDVLEINSYSGSFYADAEVILCIGLILEMIETFDDARFPGIVGSYDNIGSAGELNFA